MVKWVCVFCLGLLLWGFAADMANAYGRPVTEPTNQVWPCSYPYKLGLCAKGE